jgi:hypothetical protein
MVSTRFSSENQMNAMDPNMAGQTIKLELPEDVVALLGSVENIAVRARTALVLDLLRTAEISQSQAAGLLGVTRYEILDLMARHCIPSGPLTAAEMPRDIEDAGRFARSATDLC